MRTDLTIFWDEIGVLSIKVFSFISYLLMVDSCNYTFNILHYIVSDERPINENDMQRIWKEAFIATYKVLLM